MRNQNKADKENSKKNLKKIIIVTMIFSKTFDSIYGREKIEWSNFWYSQANHLDNRRRILLIGDSTVRMVRSTFEKAIQCPVDMLGSSSALNDILFKSQIEAFFVSSSYRYTDVFIQMGHHSVRNVNGDYYTEDDFCTYKNNLWELIEYVKSFYVMEDVNIVLLSIFYSVMPIPKNLRRSSLVRFVVLWKKIFGEVWNEKRNEIVEKKNDIMSQLAKEKDIAFCDINKIMISKGRSFVHKDHIHYEDKAKPFIVNEYIKFLK